MDKQITAFVEDRGHEEFIKEIIQKIIRVNHFTFKPKVRFANSISGYGKVKRELRDFIHDCNQRIISFPDLLIVAADSNCVGYSKRLKEIRDIVGHFPSLVSYAIPEPHVERWLLIDPSAFKSVFGKGCQLPDQKCDKNRYKKLFADAIRNTGIKPVIGGLEHVHDIVQNFDIHRIQNADQNLGKFLQDLRNVFQNWEQMVSKGTSV
ncbi:MAG: hypothetical protein C4527_01940 [Candidatus Omnitrophota bacterium]|jgi:hypothetical protein|nr:MAG: hypothetical protein C4527_01940 [Candidatus Omnitrophota bacterium]